MNKEFISAMDALEKERDISKEALLDAIEQALISAYKKNYANSQNVRVNIDRETGDIEVYMIKKVVPDEEVMNDYDELTLDEAHEIDPKYQIGDIIEKKVTPRNFGRIAAQTAKQVVVQRIREAERGVIYDDFYSRQGEIITGVVSRVSNGTVFVDMNKAEGVLSVNEQVEGEDYSINNRIKVYIMDVRKSSRGTQVYVSRSHPGLVKRLFELEVPEIREGAVEIKSISREAGSRTKMAVAANDPDVDAVGACIGPRGSRVQAVVDELFGEKIDIIAWSDDPAELISSALSPASTEEVFVNTEENSATVIVPDFQLSLAIGMKGQNVRLAARLCGWKIDIRSHSQFEEEGGAEAFERKLEAEKEQAEEPEADDSSADSSADAEAPAAEDEGGDSDIFIVSDEDK
ncbi:MAG: transcription termination factor NusA [Anaerovoracaceae bacterium]|nr:transcription termination factor NusA [Bacillota bacterium]MDY2671371.1 transcription termination factor NusA [Anaerovoracaceae bacterium]